MNKESKIFIAGHKGMVGSACWRLLENEGYFNLIGKSSKDLDLRDQKAVEEFYEIEKPDIVIAAAAKVGGIWVNNQYPYEFLMDNMLIQNNLIKFSLEYNVKKFVFLGSSCIYPKHANQPLKEKYLLTDALEPTNQWYAIAKISGVKLIEAIRKEFNRDFIALMPTNLYGPGDNYNLKTSHVIPALIKKFSLASKNNSDVILWGTGEPLREFLHVDDLASAVLFVLKNNLKESLYNVGSGKEIKIKDLALIIQNMIGHQGKIIWDDSKPNGTMRKLLDSTKFKSFGWEPKEKLKESINQILKNEFQF